jgi:hypothetical protein
MLLKTEYLSDKKIKDEFVIVKNKYFTIDRLELHQDFKMAKNKYEKIYFKKSPLIKLKDTYDVDYKDKFAVITSINESLDLPCIGQRSYNILLNNKQLTIMGYHIDSVLNGI